MKYLLNLLCKKLALVRGKKEIVQCSHWVLRFSQAAGAERAAPPAEGRAKGAAAAEQQAAAAKGADLPPL